MALQLRRDRALINHTYADNLMCHDPKLTWVRDFSSQPKAMMDRSSAEVFIVSNVAASIQTKPIAPLDVGGVVTPER